MLKKFYFERSSRERGDFGLKSEVLHLKTLENIDDFTVWEVDGKYIRDHVNREFTNFGQHYRFPFIPVHEFWIDHECTPGETDFFINHLIVEWHLMRSGNDYDMALAAGDLIEKKERAKSAAMLKAKNEIRSLHTKIPPELYRQRLSKFTSGDVWVVSGELVRDLFFIDFTEGGHHFVYDFVPLKEVWIDDDLSVGERPFVILHELHERYLMYKGLNYGQAHRSSSIIEYKCRTNPKLLARFLREEEQKNLTI